jgi:hypothetical protein
LDRPGGVDGGDLAVTGTTVDTVIAALTATFDTALGAEWTVIDGPYYDVPTSNFVCVGFNGDHEGPAVDLNPHRGDAAFHSDADMYDVHCFLSAHVGVQGSHPLRTIAFAAFNALDAAIGADRTLGHVAALTRVGEGVLHQGVGERGPTAAIRFTVEINAWK